MTIHLKQKEVLNLALLILPNRMTGLVLCEPIELYNILNQVTKLSRLTEPNYLCLLGEYFKKYVVDSFLQRLLSMNQQT